MDPLVFQLALFASGVGSALAVWKLEPRFQRWLQARRTGKWRAVARALQLDWHAEQQRISGWARSRYLAVWLESGRTHVAAQLWPPLDLGLTPPGPENLDWLSRRVRVAKDTAARALDPERAGQLLAGEVGEKLKSSPWEIVLTDAFVVLASWGVESPTSVEAMLERSIEVAELVDAARERVAPPVALDAVTAGWAELAKRAGLTPTHTPFGYVGTDRDQEVRVFLRRKGRSVWAVQVMAEFQRPLGIGFVARRRDVQGDQPWSMQDALTGDPAFDSEFSVSSFETQYVRQALSAPARKRLCELRQSWKEVTVDDYGVLIEANGADGETVDRMLEDARSAAELVDFVHPRKKLAAYR